MNYSKATHKIAQPKMSIGTIRSGTRMYIKTSKATKTVPMNKYGNVISTNMQTV